MPIENLEMVYDGLGSFWKAVDVRGQSWMFPDADFDQNDALNGFNGNSCSLVLVV